MQLTIISLVSVVTTLFTVGIILGLSVFIGQRLKDTSVSHTTMVVKGTNTPVQVASSDFQVCCPDLAACMRLTCTLNE
jgi:hypothetical protein